jgi:RNA polymerase sigma factor (sigma-70 family)
MRKATHGTTERRGAAGVPARHVTPGQLEAFYIAEYPKLVKILRVMDATLAEAEAAAQEAMADFVKRSRATQAPVRSPAAYVRRAAIRFFVKERQRDRERLPREIKGGHLTLPTYLDEGLHVCEDEQWAEHVLESLTPAQRDVVKLVMDGASTREIAAQLGKKEVTIRQHLKNGRDHLLVHPEIAPRVPRELKARKPGPGGMGSAATSAPRKEEVQ